MDKEHGISGAQRELHHTSGNGITQSEGSKWDGLICHPLDCDRTRTKVPGSALLFQMPDRVGYPTQSYPIVDIGSPTELYSQLAYFRPKGGFTMVVLSSVRCLHFGIIRNCKGIADMIENGSYKDSTKLLPLPQGSNDHDQKSLASALKIDVEDLPFNLGFFACYLLTYITVPDSKATLTLVVYFQVYFEYTVENKQHNGEIGNDDLRTKSPDCRLLGHHGIFCATIVALHHKELPRDQKSFQQVGTFVSCNSVVIVAVAKGVRLELSRSRYPDFRRNLLLLQY
ncbi:hypothetical protein PHJA_000994600 [Phtheirospermum japonicum]|uniref:Uncharacterized protein n=1 Tax=Phtheirospermum japonicum TaxID=374723 RepID=A0A830BRH2_9LAMI|nr:hypothetical protein PHJA_000994600 [Phtheirospermum japonicum]